MPPVKRCHHVDSPPVRCRLERNASIAIGVLTRLRGGLISRRVYSLLAMNSDRLKTYHILCAPPISKNGSQTGAIKSATESAIETDFCIKTKAIKRRVRPSINNGHGSKRKPIFSVILSFAFSTLFRKGIMRLSITKIRGAVKHRVFLCALNSRVATVFQALKVARVIKIH